MVRTCGLSLLGGGPCSSVCDVCVFVLVLYLSPL